MSYREINIFKRADEETKANYKLEQTAYIVYMMVGSYMITGILSTFVNAYPNKRVIGYSYFEQIRDIAPGIILSLAAGAIAWPLNLLMMPDAILILLQTVIMLASYLVLSKIFKVESYEYLVTTAKEMISNRKTGSASK